LGLWRSGDGGREASGFRVLGPRSEGLELETGRALPTLKGHSAAVYGVAVLPDGKRVVSASKDNTLKVWDLKTGRIIATFHCDATAHCCASATPNVVVAEAARP